MSLGYFSTLMTISGQAIALVMTFYGACLVYLQQQRDKYREGLERDFQELDRTMHALEKEPREKILKKLRERLSWP